MKRRTFIMAAFAAAAVAVVPIINYRRKHLLQVDPLMRPDTLAHFCDGRTISDIGFRYRQQVPEENKQKKLVDLLLTTDKGQKMQATDDRALREMLEKKIRKEFREGKIVIENGWVLAETEARQCALFSFSNK